MNAILLFGMMASSYVSGPFVGQTGFAPPQIFTLIVKIVTFLWIVVVLRESLGYFTDANNTTKINQESKVAVLKTLHKQPLLMWRTLVKPRQKRGQLYIAVLVNVFDFCFTVGVFSVVQLYFMNSPFCWPPHQIGLYDGTSLLVSGLGTTIGVKLGMHFLSESTLSVLSTILASSYYFMLVFVETRQLAYAGKFCIDQLVINLQSHVFTCNNEACQKRSSVSQEYITMNSFNKKQCSFYQTQKRFLQMLSI